MDRKNESENCLNKLNELKFCEKFFFKQILKVSPFYLEKQKSFIPKKKIKPVSLSKQKKLCLLTQFSGKVLVYTV